MQRLLCTSLIATAAFALGSAAGATEQKTDSDAQPSAAETRIPFASAHGIRGWRALDRDTLLIEGVGKKWYRAELMGGCFGLNHAWRIGFETEADGSVDRFSAVIVDGQRCQLRSVTETSKPARASDEHGTPPQTDAK